MTGDLEGGAARQPVGLSIMVEEECARLVRKEHPSAVGATIRHVGCFAEFGRSVLEGSLDIRYCLFDQGIIRLP